MPTFEKFERLNALIDIWIDEEKYELIENVFIENLDPELAVPLKKAFQTEKKCTCNSKKGNDKDQDRLWQTLLIEKKESIPIKAVKIPPERFIYSKNLPYLKDWPVYKIQNNVQEGYWSRLFWAKLIRSKIQQKGTECYFRRLDQVVELLERNLPLVEPDKKKEEKLQKKQQKLTAIYLLEMATAGVEVDIRSFAERARRVLKEIRDSNEKGKNKDNSTAKEAFADFYELLARYNIGVGYLHASEYRNAVLEFNFIISEFGKIKHPEKLEDKKDQEKYNNLRKLIRKRFGYELLYYPAILYRAEIQLKLQLAYHARSTIYNHLPLKELSEYKKAKAGLIKIEAFLQMDQKDESLRALNMVVSSIKGSKPSLIKRKLKWEEIFDNIKNTPDGKMDNVKGRALGLMMDWQLQQLRKNMIQDDNIEEERKQFQYYIRLSELLGIYKERVQFHYLGMRSYLEQLAKYLILLVKKVQNLDKEAEKVKVQNEEQHIEYLGLARKHFELAINGYETHKQYFFREKKDIEKAGACFFNNKPIKEYLKRLRSEHYDEFTGNMRNFYGAITKEESPDIKHLKKDEEKFLEQLFEIEKEDRNDLACRKRELVMHLAERNDRYGLKHILRKDKPGFEELSWCEVCHPIYTAHAFNKLLSSECWQQKKWENNQKQRLKKSPSFTDKRHESAELYSKDYDQIIENWNNQFLMHLEYTSIHEPRDQSLHFLGLQRWNSASPALGRSLGGGYLIYHTDKTGRIDLGVALDPGFDFLRNLFHVGFSLADIDVVLLSHAHLDHVRDFESMVTLCHELKDRKNRMLKLHTIMTLGVYRRLERVIESPGLRDFIEPYVLDIEKEINQEFVRPYLKDIRNDNGDNHEFLKIKYSTKFEFVQKKKEEGERTRPSTRFKAVIQNRGENTEQNTCDLLTLKIIPTRAYHNDYSEYSDSFGFKIFIKDNDPFSPLDYKIGYTGDTSWYSDIMKQYEDCDALLVHLGSLIDREKKCEHYDKAEKCFELVKEKNHPYLIGMMHFLTELDNKKKDPTPLVMIGEFGEELRGRIRLDLVERFKKAYENIGVLPVDVGMDVLLVEKNDENNDRTFKNGNEYPKVWCVQCRKFVSLDDVDFKRYGHDEALFCVCETCKKSTPHDVLQDRLRTLYEIGRELHTR